jgi:hypothetical protein
MKTVLTAALLLSLLPGAMPEGGVVKGTVRFQGQAPPGRKYAVAGLIGEAEKLYPKGIVVDPVPVDAENHVQGCLVFVRKGLEGRSFTAPKEPVKLAFDRFLLKPRMLGIMVGQELVTESRDPFHNLHVMPHQNKESNAGLPGRGTSLRRSFTEPEVGSQPTPSLPGAFCQTGCGRPATKQSGYLWAWHCDPAVSAQEKKQALRQLHQIVHDDDRFPEHFGPGLLWGGGVGIFPSRDTDEEFLEGGLLLRARFFLMLGAPLVIRLAIDEFAAFFLGHGQTFFIRRVLHPVRQAVAAETGQIHQIDVLDVGTGAQVADQAPENGGFQFRSGFVVDRHGLGPGLGSCVRWSRAY